MLKPTIKSPCSEDWSKMKVGLISRHCEKCALDVMDFTTWTRHDIIHFLIENRENRVCGRMRLSQPDISHNELEAYVRAESLKKSWKQHYWKVLSMASLMLVACQSGSSPEGDVIGQIEIEEEVPDSLLPTVIAKADSIQAVKDACKTTQKVKDPHKPSPTIDSIEIMGEVAVAGIMHDPIVEPTAPPEPDTSWKEKLYKFPEVMPSFGNGSDSALFLYIKQHLIYPEDARQRQIEGRAIVRFTVTKQGTLQDIEILRSPANLASIDSSVMKLMTGFPQWNPGKMRGEAVNVQMHLPINFRIE